MEPSPLVPGLFRRSIVTAAGILGAVGVSAAAAAAHGGDLRVVGSLALIALAHAPVLLVLGLHAGGRLLNSVAVAIGFGALLFSADLAIRHLTGERLFPLSAPIGDTAMLLGWLMLIPAGCSGGGGDIRSGMTAIPDAILLATGPWPPRPWQSAFARHGGHRPVFVWPEVPAPARVRYAVVWKPSAGALAGLENLAVIFSLGAGVDSIMAGRNLPDVPVVRFVSDDLTMRMTEWVVLQVLLHHRQQRAYDRQQTERVWRPLPQPAAGAVRVGIMGMGELGRAAAAACVMLGFQVAGWSRSRRRVAGVQSFSGADELDAFLRRTDILVVLLPLTGETRGILDRRLFAKLARDGALGGPVLINGGRGDLQVEADLDRSLRDGTLVGASVDVFATEPLPADSPLWTNPRLVITPHVAAETDPDVVARTILGQITVFENGGELRHVVDRRSGY